MIEQILIDGKDLNEYFGIVVLDWSGGYGIAKERDDSRIWIDKSGIDKNNANKRYDAHEFSIECYTKADTQIGAYAKVKALTDYFFQKGCVVVTVIADDQRVIHLCQRTNTITPKLNLRDIDTLYKFQLSLMDVNPNALTYTETIAGNTASILYTKGQNAFIYWGNGDSGDVSNSGTYTKDDYSQESGLIDIVVDIDKDADEINSLICDFEGFTPTGIIPDEVQFTDLSLGDVIVWSWDFGDGNASSEQNPIHTYEAEGSYTVTLQIFNEAQGSATTIKTDYIVVRRSRLLYDDTSFFIKDDSGYLLGNG